MLFIKIIGLFGLFFSISCVSESSPSYQASQIGNLQQVKNRSSCEDTKELYIECLKDKVSDTSCSFFRSMGKKIYGDKDLAEDLIIEFGMESAEECMSEIKLRENSLIPCKAHIRKNVNFLKYHVLKDLLNTCVP